MILNTKAFFNLLRTHFTLPPTARESDINGRLSLIMNGVIAADAVTQRCLRIFIGRRQ